ncbi:MAG: macro domain-containing protein, partial [Flavobacteriales bacterium]
KFLLFALSKTNEELEAQSDASSLIQALKGMLKKARSDCNGYELNIPLVGLGLSRTGLPPKLIIELIFTAIMEESKEKEIASKINLVVSCTYFEDVDLNNISRMWS